MESDSPRFLFHWLSLPQLELARSRGELRPRWKHFVLEEGRMIAGTSTCREPMLWNPDEEMPREPCLILDPARIEVPMRPIFSGEAYHLTKEVRRAQRVGRDIGPVLEHRRRMRAFSSGVEDEYFVEGSIPLSAVTGIGFEDDAEHDDPQADAIRSIAADMDLSLLDMTGWTVGCPGLAETDLLVERMLLPAAAGPAEPGRGMP